MAVSHPQQAPFVPLRGHADAWAETPAPPETFIQREIPDCALSAFRKLHAAGWAVEVVGRTQRQQSTVNEYRWSDEAWQIVQDTLENQFSPLPCGHAGLRNLGGGEYTCNYGACDVVAGREEVDG